MKKIFKYFKTIEKLFFCLFFLSLQTGICAQELTIKSMESSMDLSASKFERTAPDGQACALVKVMLAVDGCKFVGEVVGKIDFKTGEYWVYMSPGSQILTINHPEYGMLDVDFHQYGIERLESKRTYLLTLLIPHTGQKSDKGNISVNYNPTQSEVWLDGKLIGSSPEVFRDIAVGDHQVEIRKSAYATKKFKVAVLGGETVNLEGSLTAYSPVESIIIKKIPFNMILVEGGTYMMGSNDAGTDDDEKPVHQVTLSDFYIGETEVTQELWKAVMGKNPSIYKGKQLPVEYITWDDCQEFVQKLSQLSGRHFRLPTEAEWEYAARGGNKSRGYKYSGSNILEAVTISGPPTRNVKTKRPNELGIYDMTGNVSEWCQDWYGRFKNMPQTNPSGPSEPDKDKEHVCRGGSWASVSENPHITYRQYGSLTHKSNALGLRVVLCIDD